jgi:hypothetical protein
MPVPIQVKRACQLRRTLGPDHQRRPAVRPAFLGPRELFGQLLDTPSAVALEVVGPLVPSPA